MIEIVPTQPEHVATLARLQNIIFSDVPGDEAFTEAMYLSHLRVFPEGQMTALVRTDGGTVIAGSTTTFRTHDHFSGDLPYYFELIGHGYLTTHDPEGDWLYGVDVGVHPDYRGLGIGSRFYDARRTLVRRLNLRGEIVAGLLPGYPRYRATMTVDSYVARVVAGDLRDPTLSMQLRNGFRVVRLLRGYITYPPSDDTVTLLVRENLACRAPGVY